MQRHQQSSAKTQTCNSSYTRHWSKNPTSFAFWEKHVCVCVDLGDSFMYFGNQIPEHVYPPRDEVDRERMRKTSWTSTQASHFLDGCVHVCACACVCACVCVCLHACFRVLMLRILRHHGRCCTRYHQIMDTVWYSSLNWRQNYLLISHAAASLAFLLSKAFTSRHQLLAGTSMGVGSLRMSWDSDARCQTCFTDSDDTVRLTVLFLNLSL